MIVHVSQATKGGSTPCQVPGIVDLCYPSSTTRRGRVQMEGQISPTITTENVPNVIEEFTWEINGEKYIIRIRKLTPRECWKLMSFSDSDYDKAAAVCSQSQLYKQAGNSIVKDVMCRIFENLMGQTDED